VTEGFRPARLYPRLGDYVDHYAGTHPEREAIVCGRRRLNYAQLQGEVAACARALWAAGLRKGDRVAVLCTPRAEFWISFLATIRIGAIWTGVNPRYRIEEMTYLVADCQPRVLFAIGDFDGRKYAAEVQALRSAVPAIERIVSIGGSLGGATPFEEFLVAGRPVGSDEFGVAVSSVGSDDPAAIVYTSGTSGKPKGAVLSHGGLARGAVMQTGHLRIEVPVLVVNFPINHVACVADTCATTLVKGGKIIFQERFDPAASLRAVAEERCTTLGGVPTMLQMQLDLPDFDSYDLSSVELVAWGGAAMPRDSIERLARISRRLLSVYGLTETSANIVYCSEDAGLDALASAIGKPCDSVRARIVNDAGEPCPPGEAGEIQFAADLFFLGYWNRPDATKAAYTADGWFRSGDIGFLRPDGNLELVGRKSDMFKSGGYNVYPREIEIVLESLPEVAMAAVVGVADPLFQEVGHAFVVPEPGKSISEDALRQACRQRLANYKVPRRFTTTSGLPMLPVGKVDKHALRKLAAAAMPET
jgi:acyl-CoA synthetase (AMP-forming)/AMP-acid ligase II